MFETDGYAKQFTDMMSDGFIFIDSKGIIQIYNNKAKEIFGIECDYSYSHGSGKIEKGDIIVIADSSIGKDDGNLKPDALKCIGVNDGNIQKGDAIVAIGTFNDDRREISKYAYSKQFENAQKLEMNCNYKDIRIYGCVGFTSGMAIIEVNDDKYTFEYAKCIGHIVVLDGETKKMKFYQTKGYTYRGEAINDLLMGKTFSSKGKESEFHGVIGKNVFEIHSGNSTIKEFYDAAIGNDISYINEYKEINGRPTICSLIPVNKGSRRTGAVLKIKDISEIKKIIKERDEALKDLYRIKRKLSDDETTINLLPSFVGDSNEIINIKKLALKASKSNSTVLIFGESGTGKSILAKAIHDNSSYKDNPFLVVNCSSIPETLLESELFGYEGGAFTGAKSSGKIGFFESAQNGTLFLDEIGEISMPLQVKLLQVLQDKTFYKVGGRNIIKMNVRIIAATNRNLEEAIQKGMFREDLYYRINVFPIYIPPLRERKQDIYTLVNIILPKVCERMGCEEKGISGEALRLLSAYDYPGNVRELENILERAVNLAEGKTIFSKHLALKRGRQYKKVSIGELKTLRSIVNETEKEAIEDAISISGGDYKEAMNLLDISKTSFYEKVRKYKIDI
ncbi:MAG: sigma 54-interacting transcriptional regulator [Sedimentibacter sp.]|uniref:sigma-54 interaction domain-containing protein n=1 Tax=Sedimentibacter sp. TaxID=1960295 RepID=UPI002980C450|nr:sigma 54-interacting transcriptional regulator [Sedimentibacter sp.]MDW5300065.1 sigma 54-interacting transcriptional regulator [Sedimentibacter sp.]